MNIGRLGLALTRTRHDRELETVGPTGRHRVTRGELLVSEHVAKHAGAARRRICLLCRALLDWILFSSNIERRVYQRNMGKRLGKIADEATRIVIVFFTIVFLT